MTPLILVVDDQEDEREAMAELLARRAYTVESARNGREALDRLCQGGLARPDLVVLDLNMPVMDGWELLWHVAQDRWLRPIPVVVLSASPVVHDVVVVPPNVTFLAKPARPAAVVGAIVTMLARSRRARAQTVDDTGTDDDTEAGGPVGLTHGPVPATAS
jgi:CheY-like chemotaxis protein